MEEQETNEIQLAIDRLETNLDATIERANQERQSLSPELIQELRRRCKTDLFFLAYSILGYDRLSENLHGHLCAWLEANKEERFLEVLLPRGHFKSTIITIAKVIQTILPDDVGDCPFPSNLGPNARILIAHEVATMAQGYLYSIVQHFMGNPLLMALFPEVIPTPKKQRINHKELVLPRTKIWNEPTVGTIGVGGRSQGLHYDLIIFDDITGEEARDSETVNEATKLWFDSTPGFYVRLNQSRFILVGTRWGPEDIYDHVETRYGDKLKVYRRSVEEPTGEKDKDGKPVMLPLFPEEYALEDLDIHRKNPIVFAAQYMNDPSGGLVHFQEEWIQRFEWQNQSNNILIAWNSPSYQKRIVRTSELSILMLVDPATTGNLGWLIVGTDRYMRHFVLEAVQETITPERMMQKFFEKYNQYHFRGLVIEEVLFSALYKPWLDTEFRLRGQSFHVIMLKTQQKSKEARVMGLANTLAAKQLYLNDRYYSKTQDRLHGKSDLEHQILKFGSIREYHILDALAQLPQVAVAGQDPEQLRAAQRREEELLKSRSVAGYSQIKYRGM